MGFFPQPVSKRKNKQGGGYGRPESRNGEQWKVRWFYTESKHNDEEGSGRGEKKGLLKGEY